MVKGSQIGDDEEWRNKTTFPMELTSFTEEVDVISKCIRDGVMGLGLISVLAVSTCMATVSILLILQYQMSPVSSFSGDQQCIAVVAASRFFSNSTSQFPLWADLMAQQIQIIQNLVHASLLGGAGLVAAYRGDLVWLYFARNCCFYFGLAALAYHALDLWRGNARTSFVVSAILALCCMVAFVRLELVRYEVNQLVERYTMGHEANYPKYLPSTRPQLVKTRIISRLTDCLQGAAIVFTIWTTASAIREEDCNSQTRVGLLEMSYRLGAHQAFLLSLLFLVTTFPGDQSCVGGAIICSGWRLTLALSYLVPLLTSQKFTDRDVVSLINVSIELVLMSPILVIALLLYQENSESLLWTTRSTAVKYSRLHEKVDDDNDDDCSDDGSDTPDPEHIRRIQSLSMLQISKSDHFSSSQRSGAFLVWISSACLLAGMTAECFMLLQSGNGIDGLGAEVYQWGMHICAMYLFCTHMSVNSPAVYKRARWLMAIACPGGTAVAAWQVWVLFSNKTTDVDKATLLASGLFIVRAMCGVGQCIGICLLSSIEPESKTSLSEKESSGGLESELENRLKRTSFILYYVFIPSLFLNVVGEGYFASCGQPLLSPTTPGCIQDFFLLAKSWPGFGTFFHFGGLLVIFASDAVLQASYPPSLAIASLFSAHATILVAADLVINMFLTDSTWVIHQLIPKVLWMLSVGWLWMSFRRLWTWRVAEA